MSATHLLLLDSREYNFHAIELPDQDPRVVTSVGCGPKGAILVTKERGVFYSNGAKDGPLTRNTWKQPSGLTKYEVSRVESGLSHHVAVTTDYKLVTWGKNNQGQLGRRVPKGRHSTFVNASQVSSLQHIKTLDVSCGSNHSMCLSDVGHVYTWGSNDSGQLGPTNGLTDTCIPQIVLAVRNTPIVQISAGGKHSVALSASGQVFCWGSNQFGQLGFNSKKGCSIPVNDTSLCGRTIASISCGENHTVVLTKDGRVFTCGLGSSGQLGYEDSRENTFTPRQIKHLKNVSQIACGRNHTLALIKSTNELHVFGFGEPHNIYLPNQHLESSLVCGGMWSYVYQSSSDGNEKAEIVRQKSCLLTLDVVQDYMNQNRDSDSDCKMRIMFEKSLSRASSINGSFLLDESDAHVCSASGHGVDLEKAEQFFKEVIGSPIYDSVKKTLLILLQKLSDKHSIGHEMLRIYLVLPCCLHMDSNVYDDDIVSSLAKHFLSLGETQKSLLREWLRLISPKFFKTCVWFFKMLIIKALNRPQNDKKDTEKVIGCLEVLKVLNKINHCRREPIHSKQFCIRDLTDKIAIEREGNSSSKYSFLNNPGHKSILLKGQCEEIMETMTGTWKLTVERDNPVVSTRFLVSQKEEVLRQRLNVIFRGETPTNSGDGIRQEYFRLLFEELVHPKFGVFQYGGETKLHWFKNGSNPDNVYLTGLMCGLALYNGVIVHLTFPAVFYKKLLDIHVTLEDLSELNPQVHQTLKEMICYDGEDFGSKFSQTFTTPAGEELRAGGKTLKVTQNNKQDFVNELIHHFVNTSVEEEFKKFYDGFYTGVPGDLLKSLNNKELEEILIGNQRYDFRVLEHATVIEPEDFKTSKTVGFFWEVVRQLALEDQKAFLRWVTGTDRIPACGMKGMSFIIVPRLDLLPENVDMFLPRVWTCNNCLELPCYTNKESLKMQLLCVIRSDSEFSLM